MPDSVGLKQTAREVDSLSRDYAKDLEAVYNMMKEDTLKLTKKAVREGWTPEQLIRKVEELI